MAKTAKLTHKTPYIVYVDKSVMDKPDVLFDAAFAHLVKKDVDIAKRRRFMVEFMRAVTGSDKLRVVADWVEIRDAATFPFRKHNEDRGAKSVAELEAEIAADEGAAETEVEAQSAPDTETDTDEESPTQSDEETDADTPGI